MTSGRTRAIRSPKADLPVSAQSGPNPSQRRLGFEPISLRPTPDGAAPPPAAVDSAVRAGAGAVNTTRTRIPRKIKSQ
jgi:hypothetical protein